jgi:hypothetical protein
MTIEIKPGVLCFVRNHPCISPDMVGRIVTVVEISDCGCQTCDAQRIAGETVWFVTADWIWGLSILGRNRATCPQRFLIPIAPPGLADETVRDINAPTLAGVV